MNVSDKSRNNKIETVKMPWKWYIKSLWREAYIHIIENISEETMRPVNHLLNQSLVPCDPINKQNSLKLYRCFIDKEIKASYENRFDKNLMVESGIWIEIVNLRNEEWGLNVEGSLSSWLCINRTGTSLKMMETVFLLLRSFSVKF